MNLFHAISVIALRGVLTDDAEYRLRKIFRWYSRTFATPLHEVEDLPVEDVLLAYFETSFEDMKAEEIKEQIRLLTETNEERIAREKAEEEQTTREMTDEEFLRQAEAQAREKKLRKEKKAKEDAQLLSNLLEEPVAPVEPKPEPPAMPEPVEPEIDRTFESSNLLDEALPDLPSFTPRE